ncbi:MAG: glycogen synthase GlgA [Desulfotomaculaceae bacterium]
MNVLFAIAEGYPFAKTGGLGDVGGSLPGAINQLRGRVRVIMPRYGSIPRELAKNIKPVTSFRISLGWRRQYCGLGELDYKGVRYYFIDNEYYFKRDKLYGYKDDGERYAFFCRGALESVVHLKGFRPDLLHCHDWHTALIPVMLKEFYCSDPYYYGMKTLFTIHNLRHQGIYPREALWDLLGLRDNSRAVQDLDFGGNVNYLKGALLNADGISTVSPTYAWEIQDPFYGEGLDDVLRKRKGQLVGILNGIDYDHFNPETDPCLFVNYGDSLDKKAENKSKLQALLHLPVNKQVPMIALISRLTDQKGLDLLAHILEELLQDKLQLVVLGVGERKYERMFEYFTSRYPDKIAVGLMFNEVLARRIYAGADLLLMPSLFEPCGLSQMIAMRYGTVPLVRETGGLKDSVLPFNKYTREGNGFSFANYNAHELLFTIRRALSIYRDDVPAWEKLRERARQRDFSWNRSAGKYLRLYENTIEGSF